MWQVCEEPPILEKIGPNNEFEYEYSVLSYLNKFLDKQLDGNVEDGRGLCFDLDWGTIRTSFHPYGVKGPANIELLIEYSTYLFKTKKESDLTTEEKFGWGYGND